MNFLTIYKEADAAGDMAALRAEPEPMVVVSGAREWVVAEGLCGFAWITFAGNTGWGRWTKETGVAKKSFEGGYRIWVSQYNQSWTRKKAYAEAFSEVLQRYGIVAQAQSRLD